MNSLWVTGDILELQKWDTARQKSQGNLTALLFLPRQQMMQSQYFDKRIDTSGSFVTNVHCDGTIIIIIK